MIFGFGFGGVFQSSKIEKWLIIIGIGVREKAMLRRVEKADGEKESRLS